MRSRRPLAPAPNSFGRSLVTVPQGSFYLSALFPQPPVRCDPRFHVEIYAPPHRTIVRAHGEIDMATSDTFRAALTAVLGLRPQTLVVDLDGVSFLDAGGLGILVGVANQAAQTSTPIMVVSARPHIYRLFDLTHLVDRLDVHARPTALATPTPDQAAAVAGAMRPPVLTWDRSRRTEDHDDLIRQSTHATFSRPKQGVVMTTIEPSPDPRPPETDATQPAPREHVPRSTRTSRTWTAAILFALLLTLLLVFILQNNQRVDVSFLGFNGHLPLAVAMLFAAIAGALLIAIPGTGRIYQLRRVARRLQKTRRDPVDTTRPGRQNARVRQAEH
ncbi:STAS domain-containing protein [Frankia sp. CNm7]|uniref:Anti-sigma factor antagonist n=1 Tax=Frankia nepalensis TaxID=1836974 RepID=A0A937R979_9ACTN|nr:STAS domain-containing protein [Frankia nepalensis]MBL7502840.1 STAS domain-containing protein [Frankia nepalensis]MBL7509981.1 STAS domain-containing protein [Frankia nepalensis]MBL7522200.1 STAS domain-containing protein [Frankia nepalensis]MBL7628008.1 STAS domain-containing protein [Frankia nepalensis]